MFVRYDECSIYELGTQVKKNYHTLKLENFFTYNFSFIEALFMHMKPQLITFENERGFQEFSQDASIKIKTLMDFMNDEIVLENLVFFPELNGLKYSQLVYSIRHNFQLEKVNFVKAPKGVDLELFARTFNSI